jgi:hypothetical protein
MTHKTIMNGCAQSKCVYHRGDLDCSLTHILVDSEGHCFGMTVIKNDKR